MKIAITGHTRGLGKAIYDHLAADHEVIGMSRSNGFDIMRPEQVIEAAKTCDLFFNNAHCRQQQAKLLNALHKELPIITSGSNAADYPLSNSYCFHKAQIEKVFRLCKDQTSHPQLLLRMGYLENFPEQRFIPYSDVLKAIDFWLDCPRVQVIQFDKGEY